MTLKDALSFCGRTLLYCVLITIISFFCIYLHLYKSNYTTFYTDSDYDYFIQEIDRDQSDEIKNMDCVEGIFPFSLMTFELNSRVNSMGNNGEKIALLAAESFDALAYSSFSPDQFIKCDESVLADESKNPIIIDYNLSQTEGISVGDTFKLYSENALKGETREFTVGAVSRNHCEFAKYDAVILVNEHANSDFRLLDPMICYSLAYVKTSDNDAFQTYLKNEFYPHLSFASVEDFKELDAEIQSTYYLTRADRAEIAGKDLDFSAIGMVVIITVAFLALIFVIMREQEKTLRNCKYDKTESHALIRLFLKSFVPVTIAVVIAALLCKFVIFRIVSAEIYVSAGDAAAFAGISLVVFFITIFALTWMLMRKYKMAEK